jgi:diguanylate cyclase (GGDEF)-like protein
MPGLFVGWAVASRLWMEEQVTPALGLLWWPFAILGLVSIGMGWRLLRSSQIQDRLSGMTGRVAEFQQERRTLQTQVDFLTAEREIGMILNDNLERSIVLDRVLEMTANLLRADPEGELRLYLREPRREALRPAAARLGGRAVPERELRQHGGDDAIIGPAAMQARVIFAVEAERTKTWIPLMMDGAVAGVLEIRMPDGTDLSPLAEHLEEYGRFLSLAIRAPELYHRAAYDPLTGLGSRRRFDQMLGACVERARQGGAPFTLIMIDVDHFKKVNDTHGHEAGDAVLRGAADTIRRNLRRNEAGACDGFRYGGEEMAVLVDGASAEAAARVAERIRRAVEKRTFLRRINVTVSLGVAESGRDPATTLARADAALYRAKSGGRNQVQIDK